MRFFRDLSIKAKLVLLGVASAFVAVLLFCVGDLVYSAAAIRAAKLEKLETQAAMLGFNSTAVLTFRDVAAASKLLGAFRLEPNVESAFLYDASGKLLASFQKTDADSPPPQQLLSGHRLTADGHLEVVQPVVDDGEVVGTICLHADMDDYYRQLREHAEIAAAVMLCSIVASLVLSYCLQRSISAPIMALARTAKRITTRGDYSIRMACRSADELGKLYASFNQMLDTIQTSAAELQRAHDLLEERVRQRTAQLQEEITKKEQVQADLVNAKDAAEAANRAKSQFLANMSHEIRTPLNGILGFTKLLLQGADNGDPAVRKEFLETIRTSSEHQLYLINDILDLSKLESEQMEVECIPCSAHQIIAQAISILRARAQEKGLKLEVTWAGPIPETIRSDPARLRQLLMNLVGNAIKFTETGGAQVVAQLVTTEGRSQLAIDVIDTGIGIPPDKLEAIFRPFVQADASVTRRFGGTGLGLAISRRIAAALGGQLTVESQVEVGSTFTATIDTGPLENVRFLNSPAEIVTSVPRGQQWHGNAAQLAGARILLVEDGDTNRKLIQLVLQRAGATVAAAENGQLGVDLAAQQAFDLILMDMQMPVMDGYTASSLLRQRGISVPIIALTAHAMRGDEEKCLTAGCSGFLTKPIDPDELVHAIGKILGDNGRGDHGPANVARQPDSENSPLLSTLPTEDPEFREIVEEFVARLKEQLHAIRQACAAGDFATLAQLAHWLKGAGGTAGFPAFTQPAARLQELAKQQQADRVDAVLSELCELTGRIVVPLAESAPATG
jgi:signal transduction histidine kinase/DNA-binding response OmpR family regulator